MDELPIGGGNNQWLEEFPPDAMDQAKVTEADLPLEERLISKTWATRADAFKELKVLFEAAPEKQDSEVLTAHASKWPLYFSDANPGALEQALDAFQAFLDKIKPTVLPPQLVRPTLKPLIEKSIGAAKPSLKTKGTECTLLMFEVASCFEAEVFDELEELCNSKAIKVSGPRCKRNSL